MHKFIMTYSGIKQEKDYIYSMNPDKIEAIKKFIADSKGRVIVYSCEIVKL